MEETGDSKYATEPGSPRTTGPRTRISKWHLSKVAIRLSSAGNAISAPQQRRSLTAPQEISERLHDAADNGLPTMSRSRLPSKLLISGQERQPSAGAFGPGRHSAAEVRSFMRRLMTGQGGHILFAWRRYFEPGGENTCDEAAFCSALQELGFH